MTEKVVIIVHLAVIGTFSFLIWKRDQQKVFWWALAFKLSCGIGIGLLYRYYYSTGDTWTFFNEGVEMVNVLKSHPTETFDFFWNDKLPESVKSIDSRPRSLYFLKWISVFNFLTGSNYWITALYLSCIAFFGSWYFWQTLNRNFPKLKTEALLSILFVPSIVFWGSGVIKESIATGFLFLLSGIFVSWYYSGKYSIAKLIGVLISGWALCSLKYYWLGVWLAVVIPVVLVKLLGPRIHFVEQNQKWSWIVFFLISLGGISILHPNFYYYRVFSVIAENYNAYVILSSDEDVIHFYDLDSSWWSVALNSPWALLSGLFRPFIFEARNILQVAAATENLALLILFGISVYRFRNYAKNIRVLHLAVVSYIIFLSVFLALSTPNFGTLSRFKIGFTPFLWFVLFSATGVLDRFKKLLSASKVKEL